MTDYWVVERYARAKPSGQGLGARSTVLAIAKGKRSAMRFVENWYARHLLPAKFGPLLWRNRNCEASAESEYDLQTFVLTKHRPVG